MKKTDRRFAPSKRISVRWHDEELEKIDTGVKKLKMKTRSDFIRHKTLN